MAFLDCFLCRFLMALFLMKYFTHFNSSGTENLCWIKCIWWKSQIVFCSVQILNSHRFSHKIVSGKNSQIFSDMCIDVIYTPDDDNHQKIKKNANKKRRLRLFGMATCSVNAFWFDAKNIMMMMIVFNICDVTLFSGRNIHKRTFNSKMSKKTDWNVKREMTMMKNHQKIC